MLEGTNGIKLLNLIYDNEPTSKGIAIIMFGLIAMIVLIVYIFLSYKKKNRIIAGLLVSAILFGMSIYDNYDYIYKIYEVTPVTDSYSIDLSKYEIIESKGEILYLKEIVNE